MCYRVEQLTIHLQLASGGDGRRAWKHGQGFSSPERYVLQRKNTYAKLSLEMDFESDFELRFRVWTILF